MYKLSTVGAILILFLVRQSKATIFNDAYMTLFGLRTAEFGAGYIWDDIWKARIHLEIKIPPFKPPDPIDCNAYAARTASSLTEPIITKSEPKKGKSRKRRSLDEFSENENSAENKIEVLLDNDELGFEDLKAPPESQKFCAYNVDANSVALREESEKEELEFEILRVTPEKIICSNAYSENCLIRTLHTNDFSMFWYKRYDSRTRKFRIETAYEVNNPALNITTTKEILYRKTDLVNDLQNRKISVINYRCVGSPFTGVKNKLGLPKEITDLQENLQSIIASNILSKNFSTTVEFEKIPKMTIVKQRETVEEQEQADKLPQNLRLDYEALIKDINDALSNMNSIETTIQTEIVKVDNGRYAFETMKSNPVNNHCGLWARAHERIKTSCVKLKKFALQEEEICKNLATEMAPDLRVVCANSALLVLQRNAISSVNRLKLDEVQRKILLNFGIELIDHRENYKLTSKLEKFKNQPVYSSLVSDIIELEKREFRLDRLKRRLQNEIKSKKFEFDARGKKIDNLSETMNNLKIVVNRIARTYEVQKANSTNLTRAGEEKFNEIEEKLANELREMVDSGLAVRTTWPFQSEAAYKSSSEDRYMNNAEHDKQVDALIGAANDMKIMVEASEKAMNVSQELISYLKAQIPILEERKNISQEFYDKAREGYLSKLEVEEKIKEAKSSLETTLKKSYSDMLKAEKAKWQKEIDKHKANATTLFREKRSAEKQVKTLSQTVENAKVTEGNLKSEIQARDTTISQLKSNGTVDQKFKGLITENMDKLNTSIQGAYFKIDEIDRVRREASNQLDINLKETCEAINANLRKVVDDLKADDLLTNPSTSSNEGEPGKMRTKRQILHGVNLLFNTYNYLSISDQEFKIESWIQRNYLEFLAVAKVQTEFSHQSNKLRTNTEKNLKALNDALMENNVAWKRMKEKINELQKFSHGTRLVLAYHVEVSAIQRLLLAALQKQNIKTRIFDSISLLKAGLLSEDLINRTNLVQIVKEMKQKIPSDLQLVFDEDNLDPFYTLPLTSHGLDEQGKPVIDLRIPLVAANRKRTPNRLFQVKTGAVPCWNSKNCDMAKNYKLRVKDDIMFIDHENEVPSLAASYTKSDLQCFNQFERRVCFVLKDQEEIPKDKCLERIVSKGSLIGSTCNFEETGESVQEFKTKETSYHLERSRHSITIRRNSIEKDDLANLTVQLLVGPSGSLPENLFKPFSFETSEAVIEARNRLAAIEGKLESQQQLYKDKLTTDMWEKTNEFLENHRESAFWKAVSFLFKLIPFIAFALVLVLTGNWFTLVLYKVVIQAEGIEASARDEITKAISGVTVKPVLSMIEKFFISIFQAAIIALLAGIILAALIFVVYNSLVKKIVVKHFYGKFRKLSIPPSESSWYAVVSYCREKNKIFFTERTIITLAYELSYDSSMILDSPDSKSTLLFANEELLLSTPIEVHMSTGNRSLIESEEIAFRESQIEWSSARRPNLKNLHAVVAEIKLCLLNN